MRNLYRLPHLNRSLRALLIGDTIVEIAAAMLGPIYALFVAKVGGDLLEASITGAVFAVAAGFMTLLASRYTEHIKSKKSVLFWSYILIGIGFFGYLFVNSIWSLLIVQVYIGLVKPVSDPAWDALYAEHVARKQSNQRWGLWEAFYYFATAAGALIGGLIAKVAGFNGIFVTMGIFCWASAFYIHRLQKKILS